MSRVIHFEIVADDPERAKKFYEKVFEWKIKMWGPVEYWLIDSGKEGEPGINGAIMKRTEEMKNEKTVNTISVPSVDGFMKKVKENGGKVLTPKMPIAGIGYFAYCQDTEGNTFGIMEEDKTAK